MYRGQYEVSPHGLQNVQITNNNCIMLYNREKEKSVIFTMTV